MKSSYELAMERLDKESGGESRPLTEDQKKAIAEADERFQAKRAEREIFLNQKIAEASAKGERSEIEAIKKQLASERVRLEEERDASKEKIRQN